MSDERLLKRSWVLPVLVAILIAGHAVIAYRVLSRMTWTVLLGLLLLVVLKHIGVFGPIYAVLKRRFRQ